MLRMVATALLLASWLVGGSHAATGDTGPADGPLPRVGDRGPVRDAPDGLSVSPAILEVEAPPARRVEVRHLVANTTGEPLELSIDVAAVPVTGDGPEIPDETVAALPADAQARLVAPVDRLLLAPGEAVELISTAEVAAGSSGLLALRATTAGGTSVAALVVVTDASLPVGLRSSLRAPGEDPAPDGETPDAPRDADAADPTGDREGPIPARTTALLELAADRHAVVDVRIRVRSWLGVLGDRTVADLVVGPDGPRILAVDQPASAPPGRLRVETVAVDRAGEASRAELATDLGLTAPAVAVILLLVTGALVGVLRRGRRLRSDGTRTGDPPADLQQPPATIDEEPPT
jgi:hypothetical protein